jgi:hypothetical protein
VKALLEVPLVHEVAVGSLEGNVPPDPVVMNQTNLGEGPLAEVPLVAVAR